MNTFSLLYSINFSIATNRKFLGSEDNKKFRYFYLTVSLDDIEQKFLNNNYYGFSDMLYMKNKSLIDNFFGVKDSKDIVNLKHISYAKTNFEVGIKLINLSNLKIK